METVTTTVSFSREQMEIEKKRLERFEKLVNGELTIRALAKSIREKRDELSPFRHRMMRDLAWCEFVGLLLILLSTLACVMTGNADVTTVSFIAALLLLLFMRKKYEIKNRATTGLLLVHRAAGEAQELLETTMKIKNEDTFIAVARGDFTAALVVTSSVNLDLDLEEIVAQFKREDSDLRAMHDDTIFPLFG